MAEASREWNDTGVRPIYVSGHRNPDTDSIASALGYGELKTRLDPRNEYVPVRLGECNPQTRWLLERSGATEPRLLPHVLLRARDVMRIEFPIAHEDDPIRAAGFAMTRAELELTPIVDGDGALAGVVTERTLARRFVRETRETSSLQEAPTPVSAIVDVLEGELLVGEDALLDQRVWVQSMDVGSAERDLRWRCRRRRQPRRRAAACARARRRAAHRLEWLHARRRHPRAGTVEERGRDRLAT